LLKQGVSCSVINPRFVKPIDWKSILDSIKVTKKLIVMEENIIAGGFGSSVLEIITQHQLIGVRVKLLGVEDTFVTHGNVDILRQHLGLNVEKIIQAATAMIGLKIANR